jgi:putative ABC transport system permease protein
VGEALARAHPETNGEIRPQVILLHDAISKAARPSLLVLMGAVLVALLIACLNLSNLLLVRSLARAREVAVRVALGAGRAQALRGTLLEALLLALAGGSLGLALAAAVLRVAAALAPAAVRATEARLDVRVLAVAFLLAVVATLAAAVLPARLVSLVRPQEALRSVERGLAGAPALRFGRVLLVAEVALSLVLLVGGGLLLKSLRRLGAVDVGFETGRVLAATVNLPTLRYPEARHRIAFFEELTRRVSALSGVESAAFANRFPLRGGWGTGVLLDSSEGASERDHRPADAQAVSVRYFETLGVPLLRGRSLGPGDHAAAAPVAVVNEAFGRLFFPGEEVLGRRFRRGSKAPWVEVVGVVADLRRDGQEAERKPGIYFAAAQTDLYPVALSDLAVRSSLAKDALALAIQKEVRALDPEQPLNRVQTLQEALDAGLASRRFAGVLLSAFAALALLLALVGIYGVTAYSVSRRRGELGLRLALGAEPSGLVRLVLSETGRSLALGLALGLAGALLLSRLLASLLFATTPSDPATYVGTAALLAAAGLLAAAVPAWRASRVHPAVALRSE